MTTATTTTTTSTTTTLTTTTDFPSSVSPPVVWEASPTAVAPQQWEACRRCSKLLPSAFLPSASSEKRWAPDGGFVCWNRVPGVSDVERVRVSRSFTTTVAGSPDTRSSPARDPPIAPPVSSSAPRRRSLLLSRRLPLSPPVLWAFPWWWLFFAPAGLWRWRLPFAQAVFLGFSSLQVSGRGAAFWVPLPPLPAP